jgi:hypothetical protein
MPELDEVFYLQAAAPEQPDHVAIKPAPLIPSRPLAEPRSRAEVAAEARAVVVRPDERRSPDGSGAVLLAMSSAMAA